MEFIAANEIENFRKLAKEYAQIIFPNDKAKELQAAQLVESIIAVHSTEIDAVYRDMKKWADMCKYCGYNQAEPKMGTYEQKADWYLKNRSKWTIAAWGTIVALLMVIGGMLNNQFSNVAKDAKYIKEEFVPMVKYNNERLNGLERMHMKGGVN